jgi:hypothetical protein
MADSHLKENQHRLAFHGALMLFAGMVYGLYVALVMTGDLPGHAEIALGAHLNALFGALWLLGMGWSLRFVVLSERLLRIAIWSTLIGAWANWIISALKAFSGDVAISFSGVGSNDVLFAARIFLVIIPCLLGPGLWVWGLHRWRAQR